MPEACCVIFTTAGSQEEAHRLAELLVSSKLAACVQVLNVSSFFMWKGELNREPEQLLLIKTAASRYAEVEAAILANHSYEVPEIVQLPIERGLPAYLSWIAESTK